MQESGLFQLVQSLLQDIVSFIPSLIGAMLVIIIGWIIARIVRKIIKKALAAIGIDKVGEQIERIDIVRKSGVEIKISGFMSSIIYYLMMLIFIVEVPIYSVCLLYLS